MKHKAGITLILSAGIVGALPVYADIIIFEHESVTSVTGQIGAIQFEAPFIITAIGDTDDRERNGTAWSIEHMSASIEIAGIGGFDLLTSTRTFVQERTDGVGLSRSRDNGGLDLFNGPHHPDFHDWDMLSSIGPISGNDGRLTQWDRDPLIETTGGILRFDDREDIEIIFTATVIPAPPAFVFLLAGLVRKRRRD